MCFSPRPSMSKARRETKCFRRSTRCAGQMSPPVQRRTTSTLPVFSSTSRTAWLPQTGQQLGELVGLGALRPLVGDDADDLRDDVAGALHDHRVADAHVLARDLVLVVQRGVGDDDAADGDRLEPGDRRQRAGAADLDVDAVEDGRRLLRRRTCARWPSAASARRSRAAPASRGGRPCRRRRRCRSRAWRAPRRCSS